MQACLIEEDPSSMERSPQFLALFLSQKYLTFIVVDFQTYA